ncbi:hypothetical protein IFM89_024673, partial [Coptis chinensis]
DSDNLFDDKSDRRLYIGNIDHKITEALLIKMFSPFGKIVAEDYLWHTRGPKRGEPRGFAFIQFNTKEVSSHFPLFNLAVIMQCLIFSIEVSMQEAELAKEKMNGKLACGRPLVVRFASEKYMVEAEGNQLKAPSEGSKSSLVGNSSGQVSRSAKIAAIKNKLKAMEDEGSSLKKPRQGDRIT